MPDHIVGKTPVRCPPKFIRGKTFLEPVTVPGDEDVEQTRKNQPDTEG